jgi:bacterioferritin-associated ferredoxin
MILCVCNGLSERDIRTAAATCGGSTVGCVYRCLGCRVRCGKCVPYVADVAREAMATDAPAAPTPARAVVEIAVAELLVEAA